MQQSIPFLFKNQIIKNPRPTPCSLRDDSTQILADNKAFASRKAYEPTHRL
jgi:hypothetical protein